MKKILLICIIIVGIAFVSGCIDGEKATDSKTSIDSQNNQKTDTQTQDLILKQTDVPGLTLKEFYFMAAPKSSELIHDGLNGPKVQITQYKDNLPLASKKVGELLKWQDDTGRQSTVYYLKYDSTKNFSTYTDWQFSQSMLKRSKDEGKYIDYGSPKIGDFSIWIEYVMDKNNPDVHIASLFYVYKTYLVSIQVIDEKEKSVNEAIRIAKIVKDRLD